MSAGRFTEFPAGVLMPFMAGVKRRALPGEYTLGAGDYRMTATPHLSFAVSCVLVTALGCSPPAQAAVGLENECQSEAALYEIPDEQQADYVAGCIASRGGYTVMEPAEETAAEDYADDAELPDADPAADDYPQ